MKKLRAMSFLVAAGALMGAARANLLEPADIIPQSHIQFDSYGNFKDDTDLVFFLKQAAQEGAIPSDFHEVKKVELLSKELKESYGSDQLWLIECMNGNSHVLKKIKKDREFEEIDRLEQVRSAQRLQPYIYPNKRDNLQLILPSRYLMYNYGGRQHIMSLMPKAQGVRFQSIMEDFERNPDDQNLISFASKAYYDLGNAMAKFYSSLGTINQTISHKDFHHGNIFYESNGLISLIDNEFIAQTLAKADNIGSDLGYLFIVSPNLLERSYPGFMDSFKARQWYQIVLPSFLYGFMQMQEKQKWTKIFPALLELILAWENVQEADSFPIRGIVKEILKDMETQFTDQHKTELTKFQFAPEIYKKCEQFPRDCKSVASNLSISLSLCLLMPLALLVIYYEGRILG